ncbi:GntR family transcriptional regulator [Aquisalibacillus elongatus]|uniref:GntR family transcriptional regulator n=1 Tax=Aquisalibacillus elongatus TaxID=485577 RepID=A0A3N5BCT5_9BACI|nr:GntR family transcriptional regulator [Aquisalibacillus elongatus]RPF55283.1 GntR family transcriptional regulator [Aquisalibacillus elongatus]
MNIQFNNRDPVYVQVVRYFKNQIAKGFLEPGQAIPSRRELANQLKINPNTAQRAYKEMEEEGLIKTEKNQPSRVTSDENVLQDLRDELIVQAVSEFVSSVKSINVSLDEALNLVKQKYEKGDSDD